MSDQRIHTVLQDSTGFIWFGTINGLNRFDGYKIVEYRNDPTDPHSLSGNWIDDLHEDGTGTLWVATRLGLNAFDRRTEQFTRYQNDPEDPDSLSSNAVLTIYEDSSGQLWFGTLGGLNRYDRESGSFTAYRHDPADPTSLSNDVVLSIHEDFAGDLWVGTYGGGLNRLDQTTGDFTTYRHDSDDPNSLSHDVIFDLYEDHADVLWVATDGAGLNRFDRDTDSFTVYRNDPDDPFSLGQDQLDTIFEDAAGALWIGTFSGGLSILDPARERFSTFRSDPAISTSLSFDSIADITMDRSGLIWLATQGGGVDIYNPRQQAFSTHRHAPGNENTLVSDKVWSLAEDADGVLWVGTQDSGLERIDRQSGEETHYPADPENPEALGHAFVSAIEPDPAGALWVGSYGGGLYRLDPTSGHFAPFRHDPADAQSLSHDTVSDLHVDAAGTLWVGTGSGLNRLDATTDTFTTVPLDPNDPQGSSRDVIWVIAEEASGDLWIGTFGRGLHRLEPASGRVTSYLHDPADPTSLSDNTIYALHIDRSGVLWIGTAGGGLNRFDAEDETFTHYDEGDGLASDRIVAILEDGEESDPVAGNLWITTGRGLSKLDRERDSFQNLSISDGVPTANFNRGGIQVDSGELLMASSDGVIEFEPDALRDDEYVPPVVFTDFLLADQAVKIGVESPLSSAIDLAEAIELSYADNIVSFEFAALNYGAPDQNRYRYRLEGFEETWTEVDSTRRLVTYTDLNPGQYVFRVTGSNGDGVWNEAGRQIALVITPPWWATGAFRIGILLLAVGLVFGVYWLRVRAIESRRRVLETQVAERTQELVSTNEQLTAETGERQKVEGQLQQRIEWLSMLSSARQTVGGAADLPQAYAVLCAEILELMDAGAVFLVRWDERGNHCAALCRAAPGCTAPDFDKLADAFHEGSTLRQTMERGTQVFLSADQVVDWPKPLANCCSSVASHGLLLTPMTIGQSVVGVTGVAILQSMPDVSPMDAEFVETVTRGLVDLTEEAHHLDQEHALVAAEERNRLARDLHDSVTQVLFSANLVGEVLPRIWRRDPVQGMKSLEELRLLTRGALAEMRTLLLELRPHAMLKTPLSELLAQLTEAIISRTDISFELFIEQAPPLPEEVHVCFYRIAQEALNNVVKHAQADQVQVNLNAMPLVSDTGLEPAYEVNLTIVDDGVGFLVESQQPGHMGLGIMNERASAIHADLVIESRLGAGTSVILTWRNRGEWGE